MNDLVGSPAHRSWTADKCKFARSLLKDFEDVLPDDKRVLTSIELAEQYASSPNMDYALDEAGGNAFAAADLCCAYSVAQKQFGNDEKSKAYRKAAVAGFYAAAAAFGTEKAHNMMIFLAQCSESSLKKNI